MTQTIVLSYKHCILHWECFLKFLRSKKLFWVPQDLNLSFIESNTFQTENKQWIFTVKRTIKWNLNSSFHENKLLLKAIHEKNTFKTKTNDVI